VLAVRIFHDLGALGAVGMGLCAIALPHRAARWLALPPVGLGRAGWTALGAFAAAFGAFALYAGDSLLFAAAGAAAMAAALAAGAGLLLGSAHLRAAGAFAGGLGAFALFYAGDPLLFAGLGAAWLAAAAVHLSQAARGPQKSPLYAAAAAESALAVLLLLPG